VSESLLIQELRSFLRSETAIHTIGMLIKGQSHEMENFVRRFEYFDQYFLCMR
jgi:hypothetical protein